MGLERLAEGAVEGVDRAVALADGVLDGLADAELDGRLGDRDAVGAVLDADAVAEPLELRR